MDTFRRLGAPTPISLNDGLSFNNNNNNVLNVVALICNLFYSCLKMNVVCYLFIVTPLMALETPEPTSSMFKLCIDVIMLYIVVV